MEELIVFGHNDLDQAGCMLNVEFKFKGIPKKYFHTNYANIEEITDQIIEHRNKNKNKILMITDVSFSDNKESLTRLYNHFEKVYHIDHHMYPDGFWDEFPNMTVVHDKNKSATLLCNEYFQNTGKCDALDNLSKIINAYDIWLKDHKCFPFSQELNKYFWYVGIETFVESVIQNEYVLPDNFIPIIEKIRKEIKEAIENYENKNYIHRSNGISLIFVQDDWFNDVMLREMDKFNAEFVVGLYNWGLVRIRVNQDVTYTEEQINTLRKELTGKADHGHFHAFTYKFKDKPTSNDVMREAKHIVDSIQFIKNM